MLWTWGHHAQLGLPSLEHRPEPTCEGGLEMFATRFVMLAAGMFHSAALAADGAVWTWGDGGDLGNPLGHGDEQVRLSRQGWTRRRLEDQRW